MIRMMLIALLLLFNIFLVYGFIPSSLLSSSSSSSLSLSRRSIVNMNVVSGRNQYIDINGGKICYDYFQYSKKPTIVWLPGLIRQKTEAKSINLQSWCKKNSHSFLAADYYGVGRSEGKFEEGTISRWAEDNIDLIEKVNGKEKVILVGHGVGTWISFVIAEKRPDLVDGIVGLSADPDFTEELLWKKLSDEVKNKIMTEGTYEITWGTEKYPISKNLIEDGRKNLMLTKSVIPIKCPVRLIHGMKDEEIPYEVAIRIINNLASPNAAVELLKSSTHSMETETDMKAMRSMIDEVINAFKGDFDLRSPASG